MFHQARLKLTAWYLLIIMLVSLSFSAVLYGMISQEIERFATRVQRYRIETEYRINGVIPPPRVFTTPQPFSDEELELIGDSRNRLIFFLAGINGLILISAGVLGYILAGRTLAPIKDMLDEQNRFISDSSHELRTPLTALKSSMEVFLRDKKPKLLDAKELVASGLSEVNKLQVLSDDLLTLAQYQKPSTLIKYEITNLKDTAASAQKKVKPLAENKNISLVDTVSDLNIEANKLGLVDLLVILLDNAIKYSPSNTIVTLSSVRIDGFVEISVADQGIGIKKIDLPHIFDRFYRADSARTKTDTKGYGLGLSIAKKIVESHHGSILANSKFGHGTTFIVRLPLRQPKKINTKLFS